MLHIKTLLIAMHLGGLVAALGATLILDLALLAELRGRRPSIAASGLLRPLCQVVATGLGLLAASGIGFLLHYAAQAPELLANPKLHAKVLIVLLLALNGAWIHRHLLPAYEQARGPGFIAGMAPGARLGMVASVAVSVSGWWSAFLLGLAREWNFAAPMGVFLLGYAAAFGAAFLVAAALLRRAADGPTGALAAICAVGHGSDEAGRSF